MAAQHKAVSFQSESSGSGHHLTRSCSAHVPSQKPALVHREEVVTHRLQTAQIGDPKTGELADPKAKYEKPYSLRTDKSHSARRALPSVCTEGDVSTLV